jgi:hypothetical protein
MGAVITTSELRLMVPIVVTIMAIIPTTLVAALSIC